MGVTAAGAGRARPPRARPGSGPAVPDVPEPGAFDQATAVRRTADGRYEMQPDPRFSPAPPSGDVQSAVNGGVLVAAMLRAVLDTSPHPHPVATSAHFLRVPADRAGPGGRDLAEAGQDGGRGQGLADAGRAGHDRVHRRHRVADRRLARPRAARRHAGRAGPVLDRGAAQPAAARRVRSRSRRPAASAARSISALTRRPRAGWSGTRAGPPRCAATSGCAMTGRRTRTCWPSPWTRCRRWCSGSARSAGRPTVELTWHMRAVPAAGLLRIAARCRHVGGGWFDEESEVWDSAGRLVAQSRQIARVGR